MSNLGSVLISMADMWDRKFKGEREVDDGGNIKTEGFFVWIAPSLWPRGVLATTVVILFVDLSHLT